MAHRQWNGQAWEVYERQNPRLDCSDDCGGCLDYRRQREAERMARSTPRTPPPPVADPPTPREPESTATP